MTKLSTIFFGVLMGTSVLVGAYFLPLLIAHLDGQRRTYLIIQQICFTSIFLLEVSPFLFFFDVFSIKPFFPHTLEMANGSRRDLAARDNNIDYLHYVTAPEILEMVGDFVYLLYYMLSLLHVYDVMVMVCHPFSYANFSHWKNFTRRVLMGSCCCLLLVCDNLLIILTRTWFTYQIQDNFEFQILSTK